MWLKNYRTLMLKTRFFSQVAAFLVLVLAFVELTRVGQAVTYTENVSREIVFRASVSPLVFIAGFGSRFVLLSMKETFGPFAIAASWWAGAIAVLTCTIDLHGCFLDCPANMAFYNPFTNPLMPAGVLFVSISIIRFVITAIAAISVHELNSNS
jgi:hypothetical protein